MIINEKFREKRDKIFKKMKKIIKKMKKLEKSLFFYRSELRIWIKFNFPLSICSFKYTFWFHF